jgi:hypothetical protein
MTIRELLICCCSLLLSVSLPTAYAAENAGHAIGEARDLKNDEFLYREVYCSNGNPDEVEVIYSNETGKLLARKLLDYRSGPTTPSFVQQNFYSSEVIEVGLLDGQVTMKVLDAVSSEPKKVSSTQTDDRLPVVIDAGFDEFVRSHWNSLVSGEKKRFLFPFAERDSLVELRIRPAACSYPSETDQCFKLEIANWFVRMLVKPIELGYDPELRRLTRYRGLSNIGDGSGNGLVVDIRYDYQDEPAQACGLNQARVYPDRVYPDRVDPANPRGEDKS